MKKIDLIQKLKNLEGISQDERAFLINLVNTKKKYGLVWEDKPEEVEEQLRENLPVLKEVKDKAIVNGEDYPNHILIEGDNLHALTALSFTHEGKIDVIYIDPPYNTGNKDFKYNDDYVEKEDSFRHSKWLSFVNKRLQIAKRLLSENGTIFISIDDYEVGQLKLICNEVFGESNFVGQWNWFKSATPPNLSHKIKKNVEFILAYEKKRSNIKYKGIKKDSKSDDPITKPQNTLKTLTFPPGSIRFKINDQIIQPGTYGTEKYPNKLVNQLVIENNTNKNEVSFENRFVWTQPKLIEELQNGTVINCSSSIVISYKKQNYSEEVPPNLIDESVGVDTTEEAGKYLFEIFGSKVFDYPKPTSLIKYLLTFKDNLTILDFFAGSGTTLDATIRLNYEDDGNRQCILVTNNENNICEEVTYERNKRVIQGYTNAKGVAVGGLAHNNLRYYKSEFVGRETSLKNKRELTQLATELLCIKEDCYTEQKIKIKQAKLFANARVTLLILFDDHIIPDAVELIKGMDAKEIKVYVFSMGSDPYTEDFAEVLNKVTLCALPDAIYKAYQNVLPKKKRTVPLVEEVSQTPTNENGEQLSIL